jgi:hypothetical protein
MDEVRTQWLNAKRAAAYISLNEAAFRRHVTAGKFPPSDARGERWTAQDIDSAMTGGVQAIRRSNLGAQEIESDVDAIVAASVPWLGNGPGIYFLISDGKIVYIGQSFSTMLRVRCHSSDKDFDRWHWVPCELARLNATERAYLNLFKPPLNRDPKTMALRSSAEIEGV